MMATGLALIGALSVATGQIPSGSNASLVLGQADFDSDVSLVPPTAASLRLPRSVAIHAASGKVFVLDDLNNRVLRYPSASSLANGAEAEWVFGQPDFTSSTVNQGGTAQAFTLNGPSFVLVDSNGRLWITDQSNNRILSVNNAVNRTDQNPSADKVLGHGNFTSSTSGSAPDQLTSPAGLSLDAEGRLWVADALNHRILRFDNAASKANGAFADGLIGVSGLSGTSRTRMNVPLGVIVDSQGTLWVADFLNNRVLGFDNAAAIGSGSPATRLIAADVI